MKFTRLAIIFFIAIYSLPVLAQKKPEIINSGDIIKKGVEFFDAGKYDEAAAQYGRVGRNDTNYTIAYYEEALSFYKSGKYDTVESMCRNLIAMDDYTGIEAYSLLGSALDDSKKNDEAIEWYKSALLKFPNVYIMHFNLGVSYFRAKKYDQAFQCFRKALQINPLHPTSHYFIGLMLADNKRWAEAMLAMHTALLLGPSQAVENECLNSLISIAKSNYTAQNEGVKLSEPEDPAFPKIDQLIEGKVALRKDYVIATKQDDYLMKQTQLLLETLKQQHPDEGNYFVHQYVALYNELLQPQLLKTFLYYPYKDLDNPIVNKWKSKNKKELEEFEKWVANYFDKISIDYTDTLNGEPQKLKRFFYQSGNTQALGADYDDAGHIKKGHWRFFYGTGKLKSEGNFNDKGNQEGEWKGYYASGRLSSVSYYKDGKLEGNYKSYYTNGNLRKEAVFANDDYNGNVKEYYNNGALKNEEDYVAGKEEGEVKTYHQNGNPDIELEVKADKIEGPITQYAAAGYVTVKTFGRNGEKEGPYEKYYSNGKLMEKGQIKAGKGDGQWFYYDDEGRLTKECEYINGNLTGPFKEYYENGKVSTDENYDEKGNIAGTQVLYGDDGIKYFEGQYKEGRLTGYQYFDKAGKVIQQAAEAHGEIYLKAYTPDGRLSHEGVSKNDKNQGEWTYYNHDGGMRLKQNYHNGVLTGPFQEYYWNGKMKKEGSFADGKLNGYYALYYENGKIKEEGNLVNGDWEGDAYIYATDGSVKWHYYYHEGAEKGWQTLYYPDGRLNYEYFMDGTLMSKYLIYDTLGKVASSFLNPTGTGTLKVNYFNGKPNKVGNYVKGYLNGDYKVYSGNGQLREESTYDKGYATGAGKEYHLNGKVYKNSYHKFGKSDSTWVFYDEDGIKNTIGEFRNDDRHGYWNWYYTNGKPEYSVKYIEGDKDSIATLYAPDGTIRIKENFKKGILQSYTYMGKDGKEVPAIEVPFETGKILAYYPNGNKSFEGSYYFGSRDGKFLYYYPDGKLQKEENYDKGWKQGPQIFYGTNGKIEKEETEVNDEGTGPEKQYDKNGNLILEQNYYMDMLHGPVKEYENGKLKSETNYYYGVLLSSK